MTLTQRLMEYIAAAFTGLWIQSFEHEEALTEIARLCKERNWTVATWDIDRGLRLPASDQAALATAPATTDPLAAIKALNSLAQPDQPNHSALLVMANMHRFLGSAEVVQALAHQIQAGKHNRTFILVLSPVLQIPTELERLFTVIEHDLPDRAQLEEIARGVATEAGELPDGEGLERVLEAAAGLTRYEAENAASLALVRNRCIGPETIWELKSQMLKKSGLLELHRGQENFASLGGLEALKNFCRRALARGSHQPVLARPRGILLLSPPGCGKSQFAKSLGHELGRPTLMFDIGAMYGSLVGQTEERIRQALRLADAMQPAVLFVDEAEKALAGMQSSGQTDSGVSARLMGTFLSWLNDHSSDVFVIMTCNDISKLPPELSRAERFDGVFYIDLPSAAEKAKIWPIHLKRYGLTDSPQNKRPDDRDWTGAEIQSCCRLAALLDVPLVEAARNVVPVAVTAAESVERLRRWASGRCLSAYEPGVYRFTDGSAARGGRRVARAASDN